MVNKLLHILRKISEIIAKSDDYEAVLSDIVRILAESLNVEVCSVYIHDPRADELALAATYGLKPESVGHVRMKSGEGLTGLSFKQREILNLSNPEKHPQYMYFEDTGEERYRSFLSVPLSVGGRCVGILTLQKSKAEKFPHSVIDMAKSLSTQIANLLLNAQMLQSLAGGKSGAPSSQGETETGSLMLRGVAASSGITKGKCFLFKPKDVFEEMPASLKAEDTEAELKMLDAAIKLAKEKTLELSRRAMSLISEVDASIFNVHLLFLDDKSLIDEIRAEIKARQTPAELAVKSIFLEYQSRFLKLGEQVFREKEMDLKDVMRRLVESIRQLRSGNSGTEGQAEAASEFILVAEELLPSDLIRLPTERIAGIVCGKGGATAHVAALAKALDIPALMGVKGVSEKVAHGEEIILDCHAELLYVRPGEEALRHFSDMLQSGIRPDEAGDPSVPETSDGVKVATRATISLICETSMLSKCGAQGVGLYRTEFFFMIRDYMPSEEEQTKIYSKILKEAKGEDVTIRLLDIGADKSVPYIGVPKEDNPALGLRGVRLLLSRREILKTQLRAILRAGGASASPVKLLFPMVAGASELLALKGVLSEIEGELRAEGVRYAESYKFGAMLEVPSMVFDLDSLMDMVDYMSVGSNDLLQYSFAVDRCNESVSESYTSLHPAFLRILDRIGQAFASRPDKQLALCGEMAANPIAVPLLVGAGIKDLSVAPRRIPVIKRVIRAFSSKECRALLEESMKLGNAESVRCLVREALMEKGLKDPV